MVVFWYFYTLLYFYFKYFWHYHGKKEANFSKWPVSDCLGATVTSRLEPLVRSTESLADPAAARQPLPGAGRLDCDAWRNADCSAGSGARVRSPCGAAGAGSAGGTGAAGPGDHHETHHPVSQPASSNSCRKEVSQYCVLSLKPSLANFHWRWPSW